MIKKLGLAFSFVLALAALSIAQQWPNIPIVGSGSYCSSTVNSTCVNTVPAGPTALTGNETIPGDTNLSSGQTPQTVKFSMQVLGLGPVDYQAITAGSAFYTYTVPNTSRTVIFTASGTISDERVTAPAAPVDGQRVTINSTNTITAFQFIANTGQTLAVSTPTVLTASTTVGQGYEWTYRASDAKWYRIR